MSHRSRVPRVQQHVHCDSCYSRRCRVRLEVSVSCAVIPCRLLCGALFHLCKEEDHMLLCPNVRVPCLNAEFGCQVHLPRSSQAAHLQLCPASVVCCSMEWIRWPVDDTNPHSNLALQENVMKENEVQEEALDFAMALVDQTELIARLKMKNLYPELMEEEEKEIKDQQEEMAVAEFLNGASNKDTNEGLPTSACAGNSLCESNAVEETVPDSVGKDFSINIKNYNLCEMMFGMERGACAVAEENKDKKPGEEGGTHKDTEKDGAAAAKNCPPPDTGPTGHAPWQEGVLERLGQDLTPREYNMYMVHHGQMLLTFGKIKACTPREEDFVYGSLEPIPVQTLRSFKVPDSYHYRQRVYDKPARVKSEPRSVDTSDLGATEEDWLSDEAEATLLGYAEKEVMGHKISELKGADGLYVDEGTQTYLFRTAPFKQKTTLAEVMVDRPLKLHLQLQSERVSGRHTRASCVFTFLCGHTFHRKEFATHFRYPMTSSLLSQVIRNVHSDIQTSLSGWFEQRCPLAYLGCTYSQKRFQPSTHKATVSYDRQLRSFKLHPTLEDSVGDDSQLPRNSTVQKKRRGQTGGGEDLLSLLPFEVLCHMASFLDSLSLSQLALVSQLMRQVCYSLLQERGIVTLHWEKKTYSDKGAKWKAKPVWEFSHLFSAVDSWHLADTPPISAHLNVCPYYETSPHSERVALPGMTEKRGASEERLSLVKHFTGNRNGWQQ